MTPDITLDSRIRIWVVVTDFTPVIPLTILFNVQAWFHLFQFSYSGKDPEFTMNMGSLCQNVVFFCEFLKFNSSYSQTNGNRACETNYTIIHFSLYTMHCRIDLQMCWVSKFSRSRFTVYVILSAMLAWYITQICTFESYFYCIFRRGLAPLEWGGVGNTPSPPERILAS